MPNLVDVNYKQTGKSLFTNQMGMREMQQLAFEKKDSKYILIRSFYTNNLNQKPAW